MTISQSFLIFPDVDSLEEYLLGFVGICQMSLSFGLSDVFSWLGWGYGFWGNTEAKHPVRPHIIRAFTTSTWVPGGADPSLGQGGACRVSPPYAYGLSSVLCSLEVGQ